MTWIEIGMCRVIQVERERETHSERVGVCANACFKSARHGAMKFAEDSAMDCTASIALAAASIDVLPFYIH